MTLPGLWFSAAELQALVIMQRLLKDAGGGLLEEHLGALTLPAGRPEEAPAPEPGEAANRLRFPAIAARPAGPAFGAVTSATQEGV
jgi:hypothetical protein